MFHRGAGPLETPRFLQCMARLVSLCDRANVIMLKRQQKEKPSQFSIGRGVEVTSSTLRDGHVDVVTGCGAFDPSADRTAATLRMTLYITL